MEKRDGSANATAIGWRALVCHKHPVSARLRFLVPVEQGVCLPWHLPSLSVFVEDESVQPPVEIHPALILQTLQNTLGMSVDWYVVPGFRVDFETPGAIMPVYLVALSDKDIPAAPPALRWIELPDSIPMPWLDRELLRRVYEFLLG